MKQKPRTKIGKIADKYRGLAVHAVAHKGTRIDVWPEEYDIIANALSAAPSGKLEGFSRENGGIYFRELLVMTRKRAA